MRTGPVASLDLSKRTGGERGFWPIRGRICVPTLGTVNRTFDWLETNSGEVENPPARVARDWALFALIVGAALAEVVFRTDMTWRWIGLVVGLILASATLWRRPHPLAAVALGFGPFMAVNLATIVAGSESFSLNAGLAVLVLMYALFRWGTGRQAASGSVIALAAGGLAVITDPTGVTEAIGGLVVLLLAATVGVLIRYRRIVRNQQFERVRLNERDMLARELHDTVAHHVSAIAIQAQAGQVLARSGDLGGAAEALGVIETEASSTLTEMRSVVGALRRGNETPEKSILRGVADIRDLATPAGPTGPRIEVECRGPLGDLRPGVQAALFRVAQESITNAKRHARRATRVHVLVAGSTKNVRLRVSDDGERTSLGPQPSGYGLAGMEERVTLLGGTFEAGPLPERGWAVQAIIPRAGRPT